MDYARYTDAQLERKIDALQALYDTAPSRGAERRIGDRLTRVEDELKARQADAVQAEQFAPGGPS